MRTQTTYNKIVNFDEETKEITVLDYTFEHSEDFKGATGTSFEPVSEDSYKEAMQKESVIEHILECGIPMKFYSNKVQEYYSQDNEFDIDETLRENAAKRCLKAMKDNKEIENFTFDCSYRELWDTLRKELGLTEKEAYIFNCTGGGRCFDEDFQGNINPELSEVIRNAEKKN